MCNLTKDKTLRKDEKKMIEIKNTIIGMRNTLKKLISSLDTDKERISEL